MKMIIDRAESRGFAHHGWLETYHTFSFAEYYNPQRVHFGMLRVLNDDRVAPSHGFDMHQHTNMEVISIPLKGELLHGDSIQNSHVITPGFIQVMSAGKGIYHCEYNNSHTIPVEFLQIWIIPEKEETEPVYKNYDIRPVMKPEQLNLIISPDGTAPARIHQNAWFSLGHLSAGKTIHYTVKGKDTGVYLFVIEGKIKIDEIIFNKRDGVGISKTNEIHIDTLEASYLLLMEVPMK